MGGQAEAAHQQAASRAQGLPVPSARQDDRPDGRGRCHDNIFGERLWWTVKHEWVYLRTAANGIEQKRSLAEFFDLYNLQRPHQALGWRNTGRGLSR
jgi:putative transposase